MTPPRMCVAVLVIMASVIIAAPDVDTIMTERSELVQEAAWNEGATDHEVATNTNSKLEKQEALADAHVTEDKVSLALSSDAQLLEHLKGQMSLEVVHAKQELAAHPMQPSASAHRAAKVAKRVMKQTKMVQKDQSKEKLAKLKVSEAAQLLEEDAKEQTRMMQDQKGFHINNAANKLSQAATAATAGRSTVKKYRPARRAVASATERMPEVAPEDDNDPISKELGTEREKYHSAEQSTAQLVKQDKHDVATYETDIQTLADKLAKAKNHLRETTHKLKKHLQSHNLNEHLYQKYSTKETHYKKMHALKAKIARQEDALKLQRMRMRDDQERLQKFIGQERDEAATAVKRTVKVRRDAARVGFTHTKSIGAANAAAEAKQYPSVEGAVSAVSTNLSHQHIAAQLAPQIEKLKASGLKGVSLKSAIDTLVAQTVKAKVGAAFQSDPAVANAVRKAAKAVQSRHATHSTVGAVTAARSQEATLNTADKALTAAQTKLDRKDIEDLEMAWGA